MSVAGSVIAWAGGGLAIVLAGVLLRTLVTTRGARQGHLRRGEATFIGGAQFFTTRGSWIALRSSLSSPLVELSVEPDRVMLRLSKLAQIMARPLDPPVPRVTVLPFAELRVIERYGHRGVRFRTNDRADGRDGTVFLPRRRDRPKLLEALAGAGLPLSLTR
jgi:hypothetical protein